MEEIVRREDTLKLEQEKVQVLKDISTSLAGILAQMVKKDGKVVESEGPSEEGRSEVEDSIIDDDELDLAPDLEIGGN